MGLRGSSVYRIVPPYGQFRPREIKNTDFEMSEPEPELVWTRVNPTYASAEGLSSWDRGFFVSCCCFTQNKSFGHCGLFSEHVSFHFFLSLPMYPTNMQRFRMFLPFSTQIPPSNAKLRIGLLTLRTQRDCRALMNASWRGVKSSLRFHLP